MKLIEVGKDYKNYINIDFLVRVWLEESGYYCQMITGTTYRISEDAYNKLLNYE